MTILASDSNAGQTRSDKLIMPIDEEVSVYLPAVGVLTENPADCETKTEFYTYAQNQLVKYDPLSPNSMFIFAFVESAVGLNGSEGDASINVKWTLAV